MRRSNGIWSLLIAVLFSVQTMWADQISQEAAAEIAARFTNSQPQLMARHHAPRKASDMRLAHKALQHQSEEAAFYVFNQENANGFVIVSADDRTAEDVLGYSEQGAFDIEKINPNLRWWLNRYAEEITALQTIDDSQFDPEPAVRKAKQVEAIPNLLVNRDGKEITWYQEAPYSNLCPMDQRDETRCLTGCVATAASQIMYKWEWPTKGKGESSYTWKNCMDDKCNNYKTKTLSANYGETTYDWDNMLPAYEGKSATTAQKNAVATLMYHAGVAAEMAYGGNDNGGSGAWTDDMAYGFMTYFGYKVDKFITMYSKKDYGNAHEGVPAEFSVTRDQFTAYFNADLEAGRPIIMGGEDSNGGGHEFVCCGRDANNKFYINWGWEGEDNGHFALSALKPGNYNFSSNLDALIGLRPDKKDLPKVTVTWSVDGVETPQEFTQEDELVLPANPANCESGQVFVGWTANSTVDGDKPADLFTSGKGIIVMSDTTFYAVFAEAQEGEGGGEPSESTYTFTSKAWADATNSWTSNQDGASFDTTKDGVQVTAAADGASASTKQAVSDVTKVVVNYCTNTKDGVGSIDIEIGGSKVSKDVTKSGGTTLRDLEYAFNNASGVVKITVNCSTNSIYVHSITITAGSGSSTTYSNYTTTCTTPEPVYYTIRFFDNGSQIGEAQSVLRGQQAEKPADPTPACKDYTFVGWWTETLAVDNTEAKTWITNFKATKDQDYYAIFSKTETSEGSGSQATLDITKQGYSNGAEAGTKVIDGVTFVFDKGTNNSNSPKYYSSSECVHMYPNNTLTISAESAITSLEYTFSRYDGWTAYPGTWDETTKTWTGEDTSIKFTVKSASGIQVRISKIVATIGTGSSSTTYYSSYENCGATGIEETEVELVAKKAIRNGQMVIIRGKEIYSVTGIRIQ